MIHTWSAAVEVVGALLAQHCHGGDRGSRLARRTTGGGTLMTSADVLAIGTPTAVFRILTDAEGCRRIAPAMRNA